MNDLNKEEESLILFALQRAYNRSPFWRDRFLDLGIGEADFRPGFDFQSLPLLTKQDIIADQEQDGPFGRLLSVEPEELRRIHKTSGTSSKPIFVALTEQDILDTYVTSERAYSHAGMGQGDRVIHCLSFNMWSGGVTDFIPIERVGATAIPFGVGNTTMLLHTIRNLQVNAISSTPSYMLTLRDRCQKEFGIDPKELGLRRGYFGGEGLLQLPGIREEIESAFGMTAMDANYGMSELLSIVGGEATERNGMIYHAHGVLHCEMIDIDDNPVPLTRGAKGELVFTTLRRQGQPLFRYRSNDIAEVLWSDFGEDGLLRMRFKIIGRSDEMLVIKGVNFFPQSLSSVINGFEPKVSRNFRVVRPSADDPISLNVILETGVEDEKDRADLANAVMKRVGEMLQVKITISWVPMDTLEQTGNKSKFLIEDATEILKDF
ncbi:MAG: phenylacetate--CoA ligase family protein [Rhodospirillales bacterium]